MGRWAFIKSNKITFSVVVGLVILGGVGVGVGVLSKKGCVSGLADNGLINLKGYDIKWEKQDLPIPVVVLGKLSPSAFKAANEAVMYINSVAGHPVFLLPSSNYGKHEGDATVLLTPYEGEKQDKGITKHAVKPNSGRIVSALVNLPDTGNQQVNYRVAVHELMHVLGFAHDEIETSIMFPKLIHTKVQDITMKDQALLKELYKN